MVSIICNHSAPITEDHHQRLKQAIRRDILFLIAGLFAYAIVAYVEIHAADVEIRGKFIRSFVEGDRMFTCNGKVNKPSLHVLNDGHCSMNQEERISSARSGANLDTGILDAGFILTSPIHRYLSQNRDVNDKLAMLNSVLLTIPLVYVVYITVWKGDFTLSFRLITTHLFRSLCGWFTYLPPDHEFLMSYYDFPEVFLCLFHQNCSIVSEVPETVPFVTFFSGHIATIVIIGNHLYMRKYLKLSIALHAFNWLQAVRLLATRGHYSIDLIIGYIVAVFVSSPAERLGWYFSHSLSPTLPRNALETFEILVGVRVTDSVVNWSRVAKKENTYAPKECAEQKVNYLAEDCSYDVHSETSARLALEIVSELALNRR